MKNPVISIFGKDGDYEIQVTYEGKYWIYVGWDKMVIDNIERERTRRPFTAWNMVKKSFKLVQKGVM